MSPTGPVRRHDAVVVGAGIAGLTAACVLAAAGRRVALLEAAGETGGLCRTLRSGDLAWSLALYSLRGAAPGGPLSRLLEELGIARRVPLRHAAGSYVVAIDGERFPLTTAREEMLAAAERLEPGGAGRLADLVRRILEFSPARDYGALGRASFAEAAAASGVGGRLLAAFAAPLMISLGVPPQRASAFFAFLKYQLILSGGVSIPEGGAEALVGALQERFLASGGELFLRERAEAVSVDPAGAKRVATAGRSFLADTLILAVDATRALGWLAPLLPERLAVGPRRLTPALSASLLFCSAPGSALAALGLERAPQAIVVGSADLDELHRGLREGREGSAEGIVGLSSPAAWRLPVPAGAAVPLSAFFLARPGERDRAADSRALLERLQRIVPGLPPTVAAHSALGPRELEALAGNRDGSFCGWEMGPERYGGARIPAKLPVPGVFLAGHWTDPGPSVLNAALSGRTAALKALG